MLTNPVRPALVAAALLAVTAWADEPKAAKAVLETVGYVVPVRPVTVSTEVTGRVVEENAVEGAVVKKGDVLARLEDTPYKAKLDAAAATLLVAEAKLLKAKRAGVKDDVLVADAEVARAGTAVRLARWHLEATTVRAPIDGTVLVRRAEVGEIASPRTPALSPVTCEMADLRELEVAIDVQERDVHLLTKGQACEIRSDAFPKTVYKGTVSRFRPVADRAKGAISVRVKIDVPDKDDRLKPEMRAVVRFLGGK